MSAYCKLTNEKQRNKYAVAPPNGKQLLAAGRSTMGYNAFAVQLQKYLSSYIRHAKLWYLQTSRITLSIVFRKLVQSSTYKKRLQSSKSNAKCGKIKNTFPSSSLGSCKQKSRKTKNSNTSNYTSSVDYRKFVPSFACQSMQVKF